MYLLRAQFQILVINKTSNINYKECFQIVDLKLKAPKFNLSHFMENFRECAKTRYLEIGEQYINQNEIYGC